MDYIIKQNQLITLMNHFHELSVAISREPVLLDHCEKIGLIFKEVLDQSSTEETEWKREKNGADDLISKLGTGL